jgi:general stress protein 26
MLDLPAEKRNFVNEFLEQPLIARIGTVDINNQPHVVPVWFGWDGESLWISSYSNTRKVHDLMANPKFRSRLMWLFWEERPKQSYLRAAQP